MLQVCQMDFLADSVFFPTCVSTHDSSICLGSSSMSTVADWQLFWCSRENMTWTRGSKIVLFFLLR